METGAEESAPRTARTTHETNVETLPGWSARAAALRVKQGRGSAETALAGTGAPGCAQEIYWKAVTGPRPEESKKARPPARWQKEVPPLRRLPWVTRWG